MKFVHIADMHFDAPFTMLNEQTNFGKIRRLDQREALKKIIEYIKQNNIPYLFIAGDLYEHNTIRKSTIQYINNLFKTIPQTQILITPGNHDPYIKNSMYQEMEWNENVTIFTPNIQIIKTDEADIYGVGFGDFYAQSLGIQNIQIQNKNKINILITHADLNASKKSELPYNPIQEKMLKQLGFDYVALGHIHKPNYQTQPNQNIVYPGSTISLGFDELGKHGFITGEIKKANIQISFIPIDNKEFKEIQIDVTTINDIEELIEKINNLILEENNLYKIILIGKRKFEIETLEIYKLIQKTNIIKIQNKTILNYKLEELKNDYTLKGIFIQKILNEMQEQNYTKEQLEKILEIGLSVLDK